MFIRYHVYIQNDEIKYSSSFDNETDAYRELQCMARKYVLSDKHCTIDRVTYNDDGEELERYTIF